MSGMDGHSVDMGSGAHTLNKGNANPINEFIDSD